MKLICILSLVATYLGREDFSGTFTSSYLWEVGQLEIGIAQGGSIESKANYRRPITVEAEMMSSSTSTNCISMTLFADDSGKNTEISMEIGASSVRWIFYPGNNIGTLEGDGDQRGVLVWRKVKLELDDSERVDFYIDNEHRYNDTSIQIEGKLRFVAGCTSMKIKNIKISKYIKI